MPISSRRENIDVVMKHSPVESTRGLPEPPEQLIQITAVKVRKAALLKPDGSEIICLGYGEGRCLSIWEQSEGFDPYSDRTSLPLEENPYDLHMINDNTCLVSSTNGNIQVVAVKNGELRTIRRFMDVHNGGDSRKIMQVDKNIYSGSSNGTLAVINVETGQVKRINSGVAGIRAITSLSGGSILATGHSSGQLMIWDARDFNKQASVIVPSKSHLDGVTALDTHPAQSNIIAFGTNAGAVGFSDIRGYSGHMQPIPYDIAASTMTDVKFHPQNGDHLICSSADGSIVHWDVTRVNSFVFSTTSKESPWLSDKLGEHVRLNSIKNASFSAINSIDVSGETILAANDIASVIVYPSYRFSLTSTR